ncbi:hypothetical protein CNMCM6106_006375 [Aspergillus hiratsukae]|uniref:DNA2/NAM7 helicase-like C-terminal domain-containing protein n=1 Tax=Aspergillus hiratsukae TaxID=1194566 RepID=A0A8H6QH05_9EURO|nr:hypothetical protein CNMCM6106_006375 [Aspergillus hiratsukae]
MQGNQADIVIVDRVVASGEPTDLGFAFDNRRANVALTRALACLIVVVNGQIINDNRLDGDESKAKVPLEILVHWKHLLNTIYRSQLRPMPETYFLPAHLLLSPRQCLTIRFLLRWTGSGADGALAEISEPFAGPQGFGYPGTLPPEIDEYLSFDCARHYSMVGSIRSIFWLFDHKDLVKVVDDPACILEDEIVTVPRNINPMGYLMNYYSEQGKTPLFIQEVYDGRALARLIFVIFRYDSCGTSSRSEHIVPSSLLKKSDVFDASETYWKLRNIVEASKYVQLAPAAATTDAITLTDDDADPTTEANTEFEPTSTADNASGLASPFDGSQYVAASELESEMSGEIDTLSIGPSGWRQLLLTHSRRIIQLSHLMD